MKQALVAALALMAAGPALAEGDIDNGETVFNRQCVSCHVVVNDDGETLAGRRGRTGPNLFNFDTRPIGTHEDFRYGDFLPKLGEDGATWTEDSFVAYVQDPTAYLRATLDDSSARGKMSFRVRSQDDAHDVWAFLTSLDTM